MPAPTGKLKYAYQTIANMELQINELKELNREMHVQVSGYLSGEEWSHWQKFNENRFKINQ
jgi:FtsZ-binding cell division protein ZapB